MDFFGVGPGEILVILIVALIIWGPERLVGISKSLGQSVHAFRKAASDLTAQVTKEIDEAKAITNPQGEDKGATPPSSGAKAIAASQTQDKSVAKPAGGDISQVQP